MDDDAGGGPQSLFLVVSWNTQATYSSSIIPLETPPPQVDNSHESASSSAANPPVFPAKFLAHFPYLKYESRPIWLEMATSSTADLYMLPDWSFKKKSKSIKEEEEEEDGTLPGFIFNLSRKNCRIIKPPLAPKYAGHTVMLGDHLYFLPQPYYSQNSPDPRFERYDTLSEKWEELEPLPRYSTDGVCLSGFIAGTAVLDDTILFYINSSNGPNILQAYNVGRNKWYPVEVLNNQCYSLVGVAVVLDKFIYGLPLYCESVVALTLTSQEKDGDLVFTCDLHKEYKVPGIRERIIPRWRESHHWTEHLVYLGKDNFCVIQSCNCSGLKECQYIQLTNIKISEEEESIVTNRFVHELKIPRGDLFSIRHCFFAPKCKTATALEHETEIVTLPPELRQFQEEYSSQTNIIDEQGGSVSQSSQSIDDADTKTPQVQEDVPQKSSASVVAGKSRAGNQSLDEQGHSIWVTNLPPDPNYSQLVKGFNRFGPIKNFNLSMDYNNTSESFVHVEFESETSKQNAIKASVLEIGNHIAMIGEKRGGTGLTQGDSHRIRSSSFPSSNKLEKHGKDSRSKTLRWRGFFSRIIRLFFVC